MNCFILLVTQARYRRKKIVYFTKYDDLSLHIVATGNYTLISALLFWHINEREKCAWYTKITSLTYDMNPEW